MQRTTLAAMAAAATLFLAACAPMGGGKPGTTAQQEANRQAVLAFYEKGLNQKDADAALQYVAAAVLNHPANGVAWLANKLAPWDECLEAGEVVLGGSFTRPTTAVPGDTFHADYGPLGSISFRFI